MNRHFRINAYCALALLAAALAPATACAGPEYLLRGQLSSWHIESAAGGSREFETGLRYMPGFEFGLDSGTGRYLELEVSLDAFWSSPGPSLAGEDDARLYRLKLAAGNELAELRLGLQRLNFGPAMVLRSLMWFDSYDPRDPLGIADGVYGMRFTYDRPDNSGLWLWCLYGNDERRGLDLLASDPDEPEIGGRVYHAVPGGEMALTFHYRKAAVPVDGIAPLDEYRFALDGRWDVLVGAWFEAVALHTDLPSLSMLPGEGLPPGADEALDSAPGEATGFLTIGSDYTFPAGNGIYVMAEHLSVGTGSRLNDLGGIRNVSALMVTYPLGYIDSLSAISFYDWEGGDFSQYVSWRRTWDDFVLDLSLFAYPDADAGTAGRTGMPARGTGAQLTLIFNH